MKQRNRYGSSVGFINSKKGLQKMLNCRNIVANGRRTSMRLDKETWNALSDICRKENTSINKLCSLIDDAKGTSGLSSSTRLFVLAYYRRTLSKYEIGLRAEELPPVPFRVQQVLNMIKES